LLLLEAYFPPPFRFQNYMVAMVNKSLLPSKLGIPLMGEIGVLSKGLIYNIEMILFRGPFACFENSWHLKEEYRRSNKRTDLAAELSKHIAWYALINAVLSPLIFMWQLLYFFFNYAPVSHQSSLSNKSIISRIAFVDLEEGTKSVGRQDLVAIWKASLAPFQ